MLFAATTISRAPVVLIAAVAIAAVAPGFLTSEPTAATELEVSVRQEPGASVPIESPLRVWGDTRPERITDVAPTYPEAARDARV